MCGWKAENLFLRKELTPARGTQDQSPDNDAARLTLALLSKLFDWKVALVIVKPEMLIRGTERVFGASGAGSRDYEVGRAFWLTCERSSSKWPRGNRLGEKSVSLPNCC